jgi:structural maintenance of chromosome 4
MKSSVEEAQQGTHALTKLKEAQRQGLISGLFGRLGDLGTIPEQFDIAISTACGQLDCYVVDTVTHGEECIKFLRENRAGKGNFICLDRVRTQHSHNMEK